MGEERAAAGLALRAAAVISHCLVVGDTDSVDAETQTEEEEGAKSHGERLCLAVLLRCDGRFCCRFLDRLTDDLCR